MAIDYDCLAASEDLFSRLPSEILMAIFKRLATFTAIKLVCVRFYRLIVLESKRLNKVSIMYLHLESLRGGRAAIFAKPCDRWSITHRLPADYAVRHAHPRLSALLRHVRLTRAVSFSHVQVGDALLADLVEPAVDLSALRELWFWWSTLNVSKRLFTAFLKAARPVRLWLLDCAFDGRLLDDKLIADQCRLRLLDVEREEGQQPTTVWAAEGDMEGIDAEHHSPQLALTDASLALLVDRDAFRIRFPGYRTLFTVEAIAVSLTHWMNKKLKPGFSIVDEDVRFWDLGRIAATATEVRQTLGMLLLRAQGFLFEEQRFCIKVANVYNGSIFCVCQFQFSCDINQEERQIVMK